MIDDMNRYTKGVRERQAELDAKQVAEGMNEPTLTCSLNESNRTQFESCSEVVERLAKCADVRLCPGCNGEARFCDICGRTRRIASFDRTKAEAILDSWRERRVRELEQQAADHELFLSQLTAALGLANDGRVWFGTGLLGKG